MTTNWQPKASIQTLKQRARILKKIRTFFDERDVIEVETPLLAAFGVTDPFLENIEATCQGQKKYLQTSPEYHMKRLLCAGMPSIYQVTKAFRDEPQGSAHNAEFTMLEWYRLGMGYHGLMLEVGELITHFLNETIETTYYTYRELFLSKVGLCPYEATESDLKRKTQTLGIHLEGSLDGKDDWLALLMTHVIEPKIAKEGMVFIYDFPPSQASLAVIEDGIAKRFECYVNGLELANGFEELGDNQLQAVRFEKDNVLRQQAGLRQKMLDQYLLAALSQGLPHCSGVALGVDRLIMLALNKQNISNVIAFDSENA